MALRIITDCGTDLPRETIEKYNLDVIPMAIYIDDKEYVDALDLEPTMIFKKMRSGSKTRTSQIMQERLMQVLEKYVAAGDEVIYLCFSSGISGSFNAGNLVKADILKDYPDFEFTIIDTKCASLGFGMVVRIALEMQEKGASKEEIIEAALFHSEHMEHIFTVDDLEYLYRGGRVSRTSAFVGGLLGIKPILDVSDEGKLVPQVKIKGRQNALKKVAEMVVARGFQLENQIVSISHGDDIEAVETVKNHLNEMSGCEKFFVSYIGSTIGAHSGPGTIAVFVLDCDSPYLKKYSI